MPIQHRFICGMTLSGKSYYALKYAAGSKKRAIVLMPPSLKIEAQKWRDIDATVFTEQSAFIRAVERSENALVIIDEAGEYCTLQNKEIHPVITRGRHRGHTVTLIAQRYSAVCPAMRGQTNICVAFRQGNTDAKLMADDYANQDILKAVQSLKEYEYVRFDRFGKLTRGKTK